MLYTINKGTVVKSLNGYDKDEFYVVLSTINNRVLLVNGKNRKMQNPKLKNIKHLNVLNLHFEFNELNINQSNNEIYKFLNKLKKNESKI